VRVKSQLILRAYRSAAGEPFVRPAGFKAGSTFSDQPWQIARP